MTTLESSNKSRPATGDRPPFDVVRIRADFPALDQTVHGKPLAYLDNAASAQKPQAALDAEAECYRRFYSNVHRGVHYLSEKATDAYEEARRKVQRFVNAAREEEMVFVRGTTEGINLVASTYGKQHVGAGDEVLITTMEHHSNIVPWQLLCEEKGARLVVAPINERGEVIVEEYEKLLSERTRIVAVTHVSNALGTINPVAEMIGMAHARGVPVLIDGAQAVPHLEVDVQELGCDFYAFSSHKLFGPTGVGALYGRLDLFADMPPYQGGGEMIRSVTFEKTEFSPPPARFEAGTPDIAGAIGMGAAIDYLQALDMNAVAAHEHDLLDYATRALEAVPEVRIIGTAANKASVISFVIGDVHAHDVGTILDREGVAVRAGHHCAQPVMDRFGVPATTRASFALYNTREEVDRLVAGVERVKELFG
ncbi:MAG: cysteine desulfurase [Acidobacteria bacterium]|nr:MAG: cysteine desulfurase [Acidobacteriota bacterium]